IGVTVPDGATYTGSNSYSLKAGDNKVSLTVKSETGFTNTYVITVDSPAAATLKVEVNGGFKEEAKKGDVNADGKISLSDLAGVQMHLLGVKTIDATKQVCADINGDGKISLSDLAAIQMHLLGVKLIG
ncbi:MAG: dockerin type I repeat-containing protein, partial [Clostridia bacterium]|nr:dockerin type I repeat-containing protein [Clostridia bacterium]